MTKSSESIPRLGTAPTFSVTEATSVGEDSELSDIARSLREIKDALALSEALSSTSKVADSERALNISDLVRENHWLIAELHEARSKAKQSEVSAKKWQRKEKQARRQIGRRDKEIATARKRIAHLRTRINKVAANEQTANARHEALAKRRSVRAALKFASMSDIFRPKRPIADKHG